MAAHARHGHAHGLHQARQLGELVPRANSKVSVDAGPPERRQQKTLTSVVYYTLAPTFTDSVAGYSTASVGEVIPAATVAQAPKSSLKSSAPSPKASAASTSKAAPAVSASASAPASASLSDLPSSIVPTQSADVTDSVILAESQTAQKSTPTSSSTATTSATAVPVVDAGMSSGGKAGLAIGIVLGFAAIAFLIFFCFRQRKKAQEREKIDDEKLDTATPAFAPVPDRAGSTRSTKTMSTAPRLDVRPTTAFFMPNRTSQMSKSNAAGNGIPMTSQPKSGLAPQGAWDRPVTAESQNRANPFGNHAEAIDPVNAAGPSIVEGVSAAGVVLAAGAAGAAAARSATSGNDGPNGAAPVGAVIKGPVRSTSRGAQNKYTPNGKGQGPFSDAARTDGGAQNTPQQVQNTAVIPMPLAGVIEESRPSTPTGQMAAAAAAAEAPLYRVHLDFSPSMPDELRVRAGEIVRLIKEFDDGWVSISFSPRTHFANTVQCMCTSDDLSAEGVLPRTCISNRPIRRPQSSPPNSANGINGQYPPNGQRRHSPPSGARSPAMNPNHRNGPQYRPHPQGRPMSPANGRNSPGPGHGPGPQYRPQQQQQGRPMSPAMGMNGSPHNGPPQGQGQPRAVTPPSALRVLTPGIGPSDSVTNIAASFPLPGSPAPSQTSHGRSSDEMPRGVPEVTVTAPVERKPVAVGRKPLPGQAQ